MNSVRYGHSTHVGCKRDHNEDYYCILPDIGLWVVADGMGGHQAGEVASGIVCDQVCKSIRSGQKLAQAILESHKSVVDSGRKGLGARGMGSTVVALHLTGHGQYQIAWVGDSRIYLYNSALQQLTRDHSFVQELIDGGAITPEEARMHPHRNIITRAIGFSGDEAENQESVQVDQLSGTLKPGDQILLCSDGLTGEVSDDQITAILKQNIDTQIKVNQLIQAALDHGGSDNVTVLLIEIP